MNKKSERIRQFRLLPGYIALGIWVLFTVVMVGWIFAASLSTTKEIYSGEALNFASGLHFENYVRAWKAQNVSMFFGNSLLYATAGTFLTVVISAPAAYVLARMRFRLNHTIRAYFSVAIGIPLAMIILPLYGMIAKAGLLKTDITTRLLMIFLYTCLNIPYTVTFLLSFFSSISSSYEEAAIIDGCTREKAFWKIMMPLAQSGIITVSVFVFLKIWNEYCQRQQCTPGGSWPVVHDPLHAVYRRLERSVCFGHDRLHAHVHSLHFHVQPDYRRCNTRRRQGLIAAFQIDRQT